MKEDIAQKLFLVHLIVSGLSSKKGHNWKVNESKMALDASSIF